MPKTVGTSIETSLENTRHRINEACAEAGRDPAQVRLIAVSKFQSERAVRQAFAAGQRDFGENYAQEALAKIEALADLEGIRWHFIGHVQGNKARSLGRHFKLIHSVDRASVATALAKDPWSQDILLQYNVATEETKSGVRDVLELQNLFTFVDKSCPSLRVAGLMALPPLDEAPGPYFAQAAEALRQLRTSAGRHSLDQLSMGTSADFEAAIAHGATYIRVGQDIFGQRENR